MSKTYVGSMSGEELRVAIVVGRFNDFITKALLEGAVDTLKQYGVKGEHIDIAWVPGAVEIPLIAQSFAKNKSIDAVITLGAVIKGETPHFDYVCNETAKGVSAVALESEKPVIFGVLTTHTTEQALERSGIKAGNKGSESAMAAIEMANLVKLID